MLAPEDNELVTNTNRGTPMGELFRRYLAAGRAVRGAAGPGLRAAARPHPGRGPHRLPRHRRRRRPRRRVLPPPRRADVLRPQRRRGPALRLPRLEVRRHRRVRRPAERARGRHLQGQGEDQGLPLRGQGRPDLGLHGAGREASRRSPSSSGRSCPRATAT